MLNSNYPSLTASGFVEAFSHSPINDPSIVGYITDSSPKNKVPDDLTESLSILDKLASLSLSAHSVTTTEMATAVSSASSFNSDVRNIEPLTNNSGMFHLVTVLLVFFEWFKLASFFCYESFLRLLVKWKVQYECLNLKKLEYIFDSLHIYVLFFWSCRYTFLFNFVLNWFIVRFLHLFLQLSKISIYKCIHSCMFLL